MKLYSYSGRNFASIAAASAYHGMKNYFSGHRIGNKFKFKDPESYTKTSTKKKKPKMHADNEPQGVSSSYVKVNSGLPKLKGMLKGHVTYRDEFTNTHIVGGNLQQHVISWYIGTAAQWLSSTTNAIATNRDSVSYGAWVNLNPLQGIAAGALTSGNTTPGTDKMGLSYATVYTDIINRAALPCFIKLHYFIAKQDTDEDCLNSYRESAESNGLYNTNFTGGAAGAIPTGSGNELLFTYAAATSTSVAFMNTIPYTNLLSKSNVRSTWKLLKTKAVTLAAADTHRVITNITCNQFCIRERTANASVIYPKGTICCVMSMQGAASVDSASNSAIVGASTIGYVVTRKIQLCPMKSPNARFDTTFVGAGNVPTGTAIASTEQLTEAIVSAVTAVT